MSAKVLSVDRGSAAWKAGIQKDWKLISINSKEILDVLDYRFYVYDADISMRFELPDGSIKNIDLEKDYGEDPGIVFDHYLMDGARGCSNRCIFCFIDQLPKGMRRSLYFKDDDARMSFLMGNYITLTNLSRRDIDRIKQMRISPINISVQATDPDVRKAMLRNDRAGECMDIMREFAEAGINMNCQIVVCPGYNDGKVLEKSLRELGEMYPAVSSLSVVPVGLTKYREKLTPIEPVTRERAREIIGIVDAQRSVNIVKNDMAAVYCGDELYIKAELDMPEEDYYEGYPQLENGVGMWRLFISEFAECMHDYRGKKFKPFCIATGVSAAALIEKELEKLPRKGGKYRVYAINNEFFGPGVNVAGLLTGRDILKQLKGKDLYTRVLIPEVMLRSGTDVFLDDITVSELEKELGVPVKTAGADAGGLLKAIYGK